MALPSPAALRAAQAARRASELLRKPLSNINGTSDRLANKGLVLPAGITPHVLARWDAAIETFQDHDPQGAGSEWRAFRARYNISDLAGLDLNGHNSNIDEIWKELASFLPYDTQVQNMLDPGRGNLPSSLTQPALQAFKLHGFCYRCDQRAPDSVQRYGFAPAYGMDAYTPAYIQGTIMARICRDATQRAAGFWIGNRDIINQTTVCVSRTLRGCGKFPSPEKTGTHYMYAFKLPLATAGFDTEARQVNVTGGRWLPGEKAVPQIQAGWILGYLPIQKNGSDTGGAGFNSYSYTITRSAWTFTGGTPADQAYLTAELNAITGGRDGTTITVTKAEDFVSGQ